jgi:N-acetylmuramic acid 6-phosphate etherase
VKKHTEKTSRYDHLEKKTVAEIIREINTEDATVHRSVEKVLPLIAGFIEAAFQRMEKGGRLFYIGAGTSGRLGIVDASECPPTFGVPHGLVTGMIAGGDGAIRKAVEFAEDSEELGWEDLQKHAIGADDVLVGIAASGTTPYVVGAVRKSREAGVLTGCITCNEGTPLAEAAEYPIEVITGPEYVTGSTRMKAGTAQKMILNMISTALMIRLGRVKGNRMVDMQLNNTKLVDRGTRMLMEELNIDYNRANELLMKYGSVREAIKGENQ